MLVYFRADSSVNIGTGHVMRCLVLADLLAQRGAECHFICRELQGSQKEFILAKGYSVHSLADGTEMSGIAHSEAKKPQQRREIQHDLDQALDARSTLEHLAGKRVDWLIVDHYGLDASWEKEIRSVVSRILVIDDLANRQHDCRLLLDQNFGRSSSDYAALVCEGTRVLCGSSYALLRPEFSAMREASLARREAAPLNRLLVSMGGTDPFLATLEVLQSIEAIAAEKQLRLTVVMGKHSPGLSRVRDFLKSKHADIELIVDSTDMAAVMAQSDLAIGAAGSTSWERCCLGIPSILVVLAKNQVFLARALEQEGAALVVDSLEKITGQLPVLLEQFFSKPKVLQETSRRAMAVCDGHGVYRVVEEMERLH